MQSKQRRAMFLSLVAHSDTRAPQPRAGNSRLIPGAQRTQKAGVCREQQWRESARACRRGTVCRPPASGCGRGSCLQLGRDHRKAVRVPPLCLVGVGTVCWVFEKDCLRQYLEKWACARGWPPAPAEGTPAVGQLACLCAGAGCVPQRARRRLGLACVEAWS